MSNDLKFTLRFDAENKQFIGQVKQAGVAVDQLGGDAGKTQSKLSGLSRESDKLTGEMGSLKNQVLGLASGFSVLFAAQQASERLSQYQDIRTQITSLVGGHEAWIEAEQYLNQVAIEHNKTFSDLSGTYARLLSLENGGLITHQQTIALFEGMSNAQSANGATTEHLGNVMYGLQQALASGTVRAEEFNQVTEPMPDLLIKLAQAANTTVGGLRQMVISGQLSSQLFGELLVKAFAKYDGAAAKTVNNVSAQTALMTRAYDDAVKAFEQPIADTFGVFAETTAQSLDTLAENADLVTTIVGVSLTAALGRGAAGMYNMAEAKLANIAAARSLAQAELASAQSKVKSTQTTVAQTQIEIKYLQALQLSNNQKFRAIGGETQLTAARARLTTATAAATAAQASLNAIAAAGSSVMALLGGPLGIAMMAAGAIGYFATQAYNAQDPTKGLKEDVNKLVAEFQSLNDQGKHALLHNLGVEADTARKALLDVQTEIRKVKGELESTHSPSMQALKQNELSKLERKAKELSAVVEKTNQQFNQLLEVQAKANMKKPEDDLANPPPINGDSEANKMLANLQKQNALYGQTTHAAKLKYELEHGSLKGINEELAKKLMLEAQSLDKKEATKENKQDTSKIDAFYEESDRINSAWLERLAIEADMENKAKIQEEYAYEARKVALSESFQSAYEQAIGNQELMDALESEYFSNKEVLYAEHEANLTAIKKQAEEERNAAALASTMMLLGSTENLFGSMADIAKAYGGEQSKSYRLMFALSKGFAVAQAGMNLMMAISNAEAVTPWYASIPAVLNAASRGAQTLASLKSMNYQGQAHDGIDRVPRENEGTWLLKANEMVLNPTQADNFRWMIEEVRGMKQLQKQVAMNYQSTNQNNVTVQPAPVTVAFLDDPEQISKYLGTDEGERAVMRIVERNK